MKINTNQALDAHQKIFDLGIEIINRKRKDYATDADPFLNFRRSEIWGVPPWKGAAIRLMDKCSRLSQLLEKKDGIGEVKDESVLDTICDAANYMAIVYLLWIEENNRQDLLDKLLEKP